ncbi:conserved hypothetical protein [Tenacibaculum sp. 190524A02b]|uniref:DUF547 domain-containing protein n=1 Tax=Tenacibaculum vairaonense TaxID=3137860 RepID=A0ABP1FA04_9FLAO
MKLKNRLVFILILVLHTYTYAQKTKTIYVDENYKEIRKYKFVKKLASFLYEVVTINKQDTVYKKLRYFEYFGKLNNIKIRQLQQLYAKRYSIDSTKTWLIHYLDTLPNKKKMPKASGILFYTPKTKDSLFISDDNQKPQETYFKNYAKHKHLESYTDYIIKLRKEFRQAKSFDKKNAMLLHFYNYNKGMPINELKSYAYFKDINKVLKKSFNDMLFKYQIILIYPNGEYYVSTAFERKKEHQKLLNKEYYNKRKRKWKQALAKNY